VTRRALLLTSVMKRGYGVSVVAAELAARLEVNGWKLDVGALEVDEHFARDGVVEMADDITTIVTYCKSNEIDIIVAQTSPYFEKLPILDHWFRTMIYEHGDPTPGLFPREKFARERGRSHKRKHVYPNVSRVVAISDFIRADIGWPSASVVLNGCDHVPDHGIKELSDFEQNASEPLRVGTLMRLGHGESFYKGIDEFASLAESHGGDGRISFAIMGRGAESDRKRWNDLGVECHLNSSDAERATFLRDLDVFLSPSMWEGFNLPLVEAQASGTVGLAFDVGAHPETTPFVMSTLDDVEFLLDTWSVDRGALARASQRSYRFARTHFVWDRTAAQFAAELDATMCASRGELWRRTKLGRSARRILGRYRIDGVVGLIRATSLRGVRLLSRQG
jgi:glycosyltransferase involved in cell wall biosynthesis